MEIPDESPKKPAQNKDNAPKNPNVEIDPLTHQVADIVSNAAAGIIHSRAKLNMLSALLNVCEEAERMRSPEDKIERSHQEYNNVEKFLLDRSESPLMEAQEAQKYLEMLKKPVQSIDESDKDKRSFKDFLEKRSPEKVEEIQKAVEQLIKSDTINEKIREILLQSSPELLQDYQDYQEVVGDLTKEQNINIILGEKSSEKDKQEFRNILKEEDKECQGWAMMEAEKARILCHALTLPKNSEKKQGIMEEAERLLGQDNVRLIQAQVQHTSDTILRLYASEQAPTNSAEELICPEILERMGEAGPNKQQLKALGDVQEFYLFRREGNTPSQQEIIHQTARTTLSALYVLEHGEWIGHTNTIKEYKEVLQSKKKDFEKFTEENNPSAPETPENPSEESSIPNPTGTNPEKPEKNQKEPKKDAFKLRMEEIGEIIDAFNEGITNPADHLDKEKILSRIEKSAKNIKGLYSMKEDDLQKIGAPKIVASAIGSHLQKENGKDKKSRLSGLIIGQLKMHGSKAQQRMFSFIYKYIKEEMVHEEGKNFGLNEGMQRSLKELGVASIDQIS